MKTAGAPMFVAIQRDNKLPSTQRQQAAATPRAAASRRTPRAPARRFAFLGVRWLATSLESRELAPAGWAELAPDKHSMKTGAAGRDAPEIQDAARRRKRCCYFGSHVTSHSQARSPRVMH